MHNTALTQKILATVEHLPTPLLQEVLDFAAFLTQRIQQPQHQQWHDLQNAQATALADVWDNKEDEVWSDALQKGA